MRQPQQPEKKTPVSRYDSMLEWVVTAFIGFVLFFIFINIMFL